MSRYVVNLSSRRALRELCAGGKGAGLARLSRCGFQVPPGFVITSTAFRDFLTDAGFDVAGTRREWTVDAVERTRERMASSDLPGRLAREIVRAYRKLGGPVAVRSSMVGEDGKALSFAGQLDTILNVGEETAVLEAVKQCWVSVYDRRVVTYLTERDGFNVGDAVRSLSMAVVVQQMVDAKAAGVAFSADPITGQRCVVVEAVRGLGQGVVGGLVDPDRYVVDARGVLAETAGADRAAPALTDHQVLRLAETVRQIAGKSGAPQDVEWAWDGQDFYILQSRPITSLLGRTIYSNKMVSDMAPGLIAPLVYSTKIVSMAENVFGGVFTQLLGPKDVDFKLLVARIRSRAYTNVTLLGNLFEQLGMPPNFFGVLSRGELIDLRRPALTVRILGAALRLGVFAWRHARIAPEIEAFIERHDEELNRYRRADWSDHDSRALLDQCDLLLRLHGELQWYIFIGPTNMMLRNRLLDRLVNRHTEGVPARELIQGLVGLKALEPNEELRQLGARARALDPELRRSLVDGDDGRIRGMLCRSEAGRALIHGVDAFLARYGFLSPNGTDFTATPWIESPKLIWRAIGRYAACPPRAVTGDSEARREAARGRVRSQLAWVHRVAFDRLLASTIVYIDLRERTSLLMSEDSYQMRRLFLAIGERLVARGELDRRTDVFYVFYSEVRQLVEEELDGDEARQLVAHRVAEMKADAAVKVPETVCGDPVSTGRAPVLRSQDHLVGIGGSSGIVRGYARIVVDPAEAPAELTRDDILIVPFTDVGWTPLFPGIGGVVAETGGQLSHSAIVAREYGIPAVVGVKQATQFLAEGQAITVDGDSGRVYLMHLELAGKGVR